MSMAPDSKKKRRNPLLYPEIREGKDKWWTLIVGKGRRSGGYYAVTPYESHTQLVHSDLNY
jgi:hypothetical protein